MREKVGTLRNTVLCFSTFCGSGGWRSRLAKAAGAEPAGQMRNEKLHAVVAGSCPSKKCAKIKKLTASGFGALLDVQMS